MYAHITNKGFPRAGDRLDISRGLSQYTGLD